MLWLRRVVALGLVALVVVVGVLVVKTIAPAVSSALGGGGDAVTTVGAGPSPLTTPTPTTTTGGPAADCTAAQVAATVAPSSTIFTWGRDVTFTVQVRNVGSVACVVDGSDAARAVVVSQGKTPVWSSADCAATTQRLLLLGPGDVDTKQVTWKRTRSAPHCATTAATGKAVGAGDYTVAVRLLGVAGDPATLTLTPKEPDPTTPAADAPTPGGEGTPSGKETPSSQKTKGAKSASSATKDTAKTTDGKTPQQGSTGSPTSASTARD
ncbi:hypothetical protein GCM10025864_24040 [Luteimicrobium album]|uniref:DUF4232 domain-containing protein n=1 Tax=Luteimicrobium album TaxID=1054550 RepID=A0ABQ6I4D6_9MICO|nr:hypothetical protein [Luteimicrobium album]GMA24645.1 hypothetical protein GCM10025864_24040 [Luteimicrobium album]